MVAGRRRACVPFKLGARASWAVRAAVSAERSSFTLRTRLTAASGERGAAPAAAAAQGLGWYAPPVDEDKAWGQVSRRSSAWPAQPATAGRPSHSKPEVAIPCPAGPRACWVRGVRLRLELDGGRRLPSGTLGRCARFLRVLLSEPMHSWLIGVTKRLLWPWGPRARLGYCVRLRMAEGGCADLRAAVRAYNPRATGASETGNKVGPNKPGAVGSSRAPQQM